MNKMFEQADAYLHHLKPNFKNCLNHFHTGITYCVCNFSFLDGTESLPNVLILLSSRPGWLSLWPLPVQALHCHFGLLPFINTNMLWINKSNYQIIKLTFKETCMLYIQNHDLGHCSKLFFFFLNHFSSLSCVSF